MPREKRSPRFAWLKSAAFLLVVLAAGSWAPASTISWFVDPGKTNLLSGGAAMPSDFRFELGVFGAGFTPTVANKAQWSSNWTSAQRVAYNPSTAIYTGEVTVTSNVAPFTVGASAWVWGFRGDYNSGEWVLFRRTDWTWPAPDPFNPFPLLWSATSANSVVLGTVNSGGMRSAAVSAALPPVASWAVWQGVELASTSGNAPGDDPDRDGANNLLEFVFGTDPMRPGPLPKLALSTVLVSGLPHLQVSVPRRADHPATLLLEVSGNLTDWSSGSAFVETISDTPAALVLRDRSVLGGKRFVRLRATIP